MSASPTGFVLPKALIKDRLRSGTRLTRIYKSHFEPLSFGPIRSRKATGRFDAPRHEYGICYFGKTFEAALVETLIRQGSGLIYQTTDLDAYAVATFVVTRPIQLAALHGRGLSSLRVHGGVVHGAYAPCREIALAINKHGNVVDGVQYRSCRNDNEYCVALFDRAADAVRLESTVPLLNDIRLATTFAAYDVLIE